MRDRHPPVLFSPGGSVLGIATTGSSSFRPRSSLMRWLAVLRVVLALIVLSPSAIVAQSSQTVSSPSVPRLITVTGMFQPANGQPAGAAETVTLSIYADQQGGAPL